MSRQIAPYLATAHGLFNAFLFLAFVYQGLTGWRNRRDRIGGAPMDFAAVRRHRKSGPILALLLVAGYLAGLVTVAIDYGTLLKFPPHLLVGTLLVVAVAATAATGSRIQGRISAWRARHAVAGLTALMLFLAQMLLGVGILL